ncbi:MAG: alkaline phosphatase family protein [Desulfosarcina sp.]|nr:alkaline phosphatase family protein [Desulfosarcina sp.]
MNPIDRLKNGFKAWSTWLSRKERFSRLLGLPRCTGIDDEPGVVLIQIDGLSYTQFQRGLTRNRLPFIRKLLEKNGYAQKPFYSGLPSSTPAVQGELFYGIKTVVPAFEFIDRKTRLRHAMFFPASANAMARQLQQTGRPLLAGGSSYSNIYSGGADTARYCAETMNLESLIRAVNPIKLALFFMLQIGKLFRILGVACLELILSVYDFFKGMASGMNIIKELKFIPTRLFVCVILRELIRLRVKMDVTRGVPIIAANFFGYDEQAHRRGPGSAFAHWTLKGIDGVVRDLYRTAMRSRCRDYQVVVYADHGQESVHSYHRHTGKPLKQAIREVIIEKIGPENSQNEEDADDNLANLYRLAGNVLFGQNGTMRGRRKAFTAGPADHVRITTMGPLGHVYLPRRVRGQFDSVDPSPALEQFARSLNRQAQIPLVLFKKKADIAAVNASGVFSLWEDREAILGKDHPFLDQTAADLKRLCLHPNAGDLVISGWEPSGTPLSFNMESGAHGGPGKEETRGFALLPSCMKNSARWLRPLDLRAQIFAYFEKEKRAS